MKESMLVIGKTFIFAGCLYIITQNHRFVKVFSKSIEKNREFIH